ncbi:MAG: hypothetical protein ACR2NU_09625, partial [Aeoliella sp.]
QNIDSLFAAGASRAKLPDLLDSHPPDSGAMELLGYLQLAHDGGHEVDLTRTDVIRLDSTEANTAYEVPRVTFLSQQLRSLDAKSPVGGAAP